MYYNIDKYAKALQYLCMNIQYCYDVELKLNKEHLFQTPSEPTNQRTQTTIIRCDPCLGKYYNNMAQIWHQALAYWKKQLLVHHIRQYCPRICLSEKY